MDYVSDFEDLQVFKTLKFFKDTRLPSKSFKGSLYAILNLVRYAIAIEKQTCAIKRLTFKPRVGQFKYKKLLFANTNLLF